MEAGRPLGEGVFRLEAYFGKVKSEKPAKHLRGKIREGIGSLSLDFGRAISIRDVNLSHQCEDDGYSPRMGKGTEDEGSWKR